MNADGLKKKKLSRSAMTLTASRVDGNRILIIRLPEKLAWNAFMGPAERACLSELLYDNELQRVHAGSQSGCPHPFPQAGVESHRSPIPSRSASSCSGLQVNGQLSRESGIPS
jgi:hypothetical protein